MTIRGILGVRIVSRSGASRMRRTPGFGWGNFGSHGRGGSLDARIRPVSFLLCLFFRRHKDYREVRFRDASPSPGIIGRSHQNLNVFLIGRRKKHYPIWYYGDMLELLCAFAAGAATSSWLHFKAKRRARASGGTPPIFGSQSPPRPGGPLGGAGRTAIILMSMPPELSARIFKELGPEEVQRITLEISQLPPIPPNLRQSVLSEFCGSLGILPERLEEAAAAEPALVAKALRVLCNLPAA